MKRDCAYFSLLSICMRYDLKEFSIEIRFHPFMYPFSILVVYYLFQSSFKYSVFCCNSTFFVLTSQKCDVNCAKDVFYIFKPSKT